VKTPTMSAIVEITVNEKDETYKTRSYLEVADEYSKKSDELPRDVLLSMILELHALANTMAEQAEVCEEEMDDYIEQRTLVGLDGVDIVKSEIKDDIDKSIDNLFEDD